MSVDQLGTFNIDSYGFIKWDISTAYAKTFKSETIKGMKVSPNGKWIIFVPNDGFFVVSTESGEVLWRSGGLFSLLHKRQPLYDPYKAYVNWYKMNECMVYINGCYYQFVVVDTKEIMDIFRDFGLSVDVITILLQFCVIENVIYRAHKIVFKAKTWINDKSLKVGDIHSFYVDGEMKIVSRRKVHYIDYNKISKQTHALFEFDTYTLK
eukprot:UN11434